MRVQFNNALVTSKLNYMLKKTLDIGKSTALFEGSNASFSCPDKSSAAMKTNAERRWNDADSKIEVLGENLPQSRSVTTPNATCTSPGSDSSLHEIS
jgi:hypothetical protein